MPIEAKVENDYFEIVYKLKEKANQTEPEDYSQIKTIKANQIARQKELYVKWTVEVALVGIMATIGSYCFDYLNQ